MAAFAQRVCEDELMDQPGLDVLQHQRALLGLQRVNWWSRTAAGIWKELSVLAIRRSLDELRVLDLACGGGDVSLALARRALKSQMPFTLHGWDKSPSAVEHASLQAERNRLSNVQFFVRDVMHDDIDDSFDAIICTLFLHHLETPDAQGLLKKMQSVAQHVVIVDDLRRTTAGYALAWLGTRILSRSPIVHTDGPLSVRAAFTCEEIRELADSAGLIGATIRPHWPQRYRLVWERT